MSSYVQKLQQDSVKQFDNEMELRRFRQEFKPAIESGLTLEQFKSQHNTTAADIRNFEIVADEVKKESVLGEAFLKGFQSTSNNAYGIKGV